MLEFGRPQAIIKALESAHLPAIVTIILMLYLLRRGNMFLSEKQTKLFLILIAFMFFHIFTAINNYWAFNVWRTMILMFIVYLSLLSYIDSPDKYYTLIKFWVFIHLFLAIFGIAKGGRGIGGFLGDENDLCMTLNMAVPFSFYMAMTEKKVLKKIFYFIVTGIMVFTCILTFSRGGFVGLVAVGGYIWIRSSRKVVFAIIVAILAMAMILLAPEKYGDRILSITEQGTKSGTGRERLYTWGVAWDMFKGNPLFGVGQGNARWEFREYEVERGFEEGLLGRSRAGRAMHSVYFTLFPELGIFGTFLFGSMIFHLFKDTRRIRDKLKSKRTASGGGTAVIDIDIASFLEASLVGFLVSGIFISTLYYPNFWILMGFVVCCRRLVCGENEKRSSSY